MVEIRDRIKELRRVRASDLEPHPENWRLHPPDQRETMAGLLEQVGYAAALIAYEPEPGRLVLIDGHLRAETTPDAEVPVLVVDLTDDEARLVLATHDPLGGMAQTEDGALAALLETVETGNEAIQALLNELSDGARPWESDIAAVEGIVPTDAGIEVTLRVRCPQVEADDLRAALTEVCDAHAGWSVL